MAILKLGRKDHRALQLSASPEVPRGTEVASVGFPAIASSAFFDLDAIGKKIASSPERSWRIEDIFPEHVFVFTQTSGRASRVFQSQEGSLVQHDAAINLGNSGGPLLGNEGIVLGINTLSPSVRLGTSEEGTTIEVSSGIFWSLGMHQFREELDRHAPGIMWR